MAEPRAVPVSQLREQHTMRTGSSRLQGRGHQRISTFPLSNTSRRKPRRWPLILRFVKGAIHGVILFPVTLHTLFTVLIVWLDNNQPGIKLGIPNSIIPSLSIVVGLMLVFRNQTSYERFWTGRNYLTQLSTSVRNLTRSFLTCSHKPGSKPLAAEKADTEMIVRLMVAILYSVKNHLRAEWGAAIVPGGSVEANGHPSFRPEYAELLPPGIQGYEADGLGLPLELMFFVEKYIRIGFDKGWFHGPQASQMQVQVNGMVDAYSRMETIRMTPLPVAHLIHQKQVLALYCCILPFAMVDDMNWWAVPIVALVTFTLYGIEGIGSQLEDPFGYDKNDIAMDAIAEDSRQEIMVMLAQWKKNGEMFAANESVSFFKS